MKSYLPTILAAALLLFPSVHASVILTENFESINDNQQLFAALGTFQASGQTNGAADWLTGQDYGSGAPGTGFNGEGGSTAIHFDKSAGTTNLRLNVDSGFDMGAAYDASVAHTVSFDFYSSTATGQVGDFRLFMTDASGGLADGLDLMIFSSLRQVRPSTGSSFGAGFPVAGGPGTQLKSDTWYRYELTINPLDTALDSFDLTVIEDGVGVVISAVGQSFDSDISDITRMEIQMFSPTAQASAFVDNITVAAVPEPSVALLSTTGLVAACFIRRRRRPSGSAE